MEKVMRQDYLLNKTVKIYQPEGLYHASTDAVWLAAAVTKVKNEEKFLDVGSGTGAVSLCLASRFRNKKIEITGLDIQKELVDASNASANANGFSFVTFEQIDILQNKYKPCSFNHVITNPPYLLNDMESPNLSKATAHNFSKQSLHKWIDFCIKALKPQGKFYMINRADALDYIITELYERLGGIEILPLFSKPNDLKAKRVIVRAQKDCRSPLILHKPIYVHNQDNSHTEEAVRILRSGLSI